MKDGDRKRINYKPKIELDTNINNTFIKDAITVDTIPNTVVIAKDITPVLTSYKKYNIGNSLNKAVNIINKIDSHLKVLNKKISSSEKYSGLEDAINNGDLVKLDKYTKLSENIDGDINAEVYPRLIKLKDHVKTLIDTINKYGFDNNIDIDELKNFIDKQQLLVDIAIKKEQKNQYVDYKEISIDVQIAKLIEDKINLINNLVRDLINIKPYNAPVLPKNIELLQDYYSNILDVYTGDKDKMDCFDSIDMTNILLKQIYELKKKVLVNRSLLMKADKNTFFSILPVAKMIEDKLSSLILDLYKTQITDEINRGDYINSFLLKNTIRDYYKQLIKTN